MSNLAVSANPYSLRNLTPGVPCALAVASSRVSRAACKRFHGFEASLKLLRSEGEPPFMSESMAAVQDAGTSFTFMQRSVAGQPLLDATLGNSTAIVPFLAYTSHLSACKRALNAQKLGYKAGVRAAEEDMFKAKVTGATGALYLGVRGLNLASYVKGIDTSSMAAPTLLGRVTYALTSLGTALYGFVYALSFRKHYNTQSDINKFRKKMEASLTITNDQDPAQLKRYVDFFRKWTLTQPAEAIANNVRGKYSNEEFVQEAFSTASELLNKVSERPLKPFEVRKVLREIMGKGLSDQEFNEVLTMLGFELKVARLKMKRALKLETMTSGACAKEMEKLALVLDSHRNLSVDAMRAFVVMTQPLVQMMTKELNKSWWIEALYMFASLVGIAAAITGLAASGGAVALAVAILFTIVSVSMTALDGYSMYQAIQKGGKKGTFDETMYYISNAIYLISTILALVTVFMLSLGIGLAIGALVIGSTGMSMNVYVRHQLNESEKRYDEEHPTLALFYERMRERRANQEALKALFNKLVESDRELLNAERENLTSRRAQSLVASRLQEIAQEEQAKRAILANLRRQVALITR